MFQRIVILSISLNFLFALNSQPAHSQNKTLMQDGGLVFQEQYEGEDDQWKMEAKSTNFNLSYRLLTFPDFTVNMAITNTGSLWVRGDIITPQNGNVGIGTPSPNERLEVAGNGRAFFGDGGDSNRKGLLIDGNEPGYYARMEAYDYGEKTGMALVLNTVGGGNVGIGTTDPQYKLDVIGNIRATGSVYYGGSAGSSNGTAYNKPDYVFEDGYQILSTDQVASYLKKTNLCLG